MIFPIYWTTMLFLISAGVFPAFSGAYQESPNAGGVIVKGQATFQGNVPKSNSIQVDRDAGYCGDSIPDDSLLVDGQTKGISQVVVSLKDVATGKALTKKTPLKVDNRDCRFQPSVSVGLTGSVLEIQSADPILHNTHILQNDRTFLNVALPPGGRTIRKTLSQPGRLDVRCDAHEFMRASLHIFDHPYFTSTDSTGNFELPGVPPGTYTLQFWHPTLGMKELSITVKKATPLVVNVSFP
jgi:plastocyanin